MCRRRVTDGTLVLLFSAWYPWYCNEHPSPNCNISSAVKQLESVRPLPWPGVGAVKQLVQLHGHGRV